MLETITDLLYDIHHNIFNRMPEQASTFAPYVDFINAFITYVAVFCTVAITGAMLYFGWKYRRRSEDQQTEYITHSTILETLWTAIPTVVCIFVFYYGFVVYKEMRTPPSNPIEINVSGRKWAWDFEYPTGRLSTGDLVVPINTPVRLIMKSQDVNHSFFIPAMRVKEDVIGNTYHYLWFQPTKTGEFDIFCTEYCGDMHSKMLGKLKVVSQAEYEDYIHERKIPGEAELTPEQAGAKLYKDKGCNACHSLDGATGVGPTFKGLFGRSGEFDDGTKYTVDENYILSSIKNPQGQIVKGYLKGVMPAIPVNDKELSALIAYLKTIK